MINIDQINQIISLLKKEKNYFSNKIGENYKNLGEQVYRKIKRKIIFHEIKPGERVFDRRLAKEMKVSRSLVRQAFTLLEKEELIKSIPRSGFYIKKISIKDIEEIYDIRKILEKAATKFAVVEIPEEEIQELDELFDCAKEDLDKKNFITFIKADTELHKMILNNYGNKRLVKLLKNYNDRFLYYRIVDLSRSERAKNSYYKHIKIFESIKNRRVEKAVQLIGEHIEHSKEIIISNFEEYNNI